MRKCDETGKKQNRDPGVETVDMMVKSSDGQSTTWKIRRRYNEIQDKKYTYD